MEMRIMDNAAILTVKRELDKYHGIVPTGDKQDLKKVRTDLNKLEKILKEDEKEKVEPFKKEIDNIKKIYKETIGEIKTVKEPIDTMIKNIENDEKEEKKRKIQAYIKEQFGELEKEIKIQEDYLNLSKSMTSIKESINNQVESIVHERELGNYIPTLQVDIRLTGKENILEKIIETLQENNLLDYVEFDRRFVK